MHTQKIALTLGIVMALFHLVWSLLIALGLAQALLDFIFWAHMIANPYHVTGFTFTQTITLLVLTFIVGYLMGWLFAWVWNYLHQK